MMPLVKVNPYPADWGVVNIDLSLFCVSYMISPSETLLPDSEVQGPAY